jgi:predicted RNase H-like HicB family nuclease
MKKKYAVVIEKGSTSFGAYVPDLPGCVAVAETCEEVHHLILEAIELHLDGMRAEGLPIPEPTSIAVEVEVSA